MRIDGKTIAHEIFHRLQEKVAHLKQKSIEPHFVIILVGDDPASHAYVRQKEQKSKLIGIKTTTVYLPSTIQQTELLTTIEQHNNDKSVHGIIVQRPLPDHIDAKAIDEAVDPAKDVDGFHPASKFEMPLAKAALILLSHVHNARVDTYSFEEWLKDKNIVVVGKGKTGGGPVITLLQKMGITPLIIDSKTQHPENVLKNADIIISAIGKPGILNASVLKKGVILIGIGMHRGADGKLHGDYEEPDVKDIASFYTPVPGGVGPINVAMLLENVIKAAEKTTH